MSAKPQAARRFVLEAVLFVSFWVFWFMAFGGVSLVMALLRGELF